MAQPIESDISVLSDRMVALSTLKDRGYFKTKIDSYESFAEFLESLGRTIKRSKVIVKKDTDNVLLSGNAITLHTDHPDVDLVAWYCVSQSDEGGHTLLLDFEEIKKRMSAAELQKLCSVMVVTPTVSGKGMRKEVRMLSRNGLYFVDWLVKKDLQNPNSTKLSEFLRVLRSLEPMKFTLQSNDVLVIDNRRMLHGRETVRERSCKRELIRHWIKRDL